MSRFNKSALWTVGVLAVGGLLFWLVLALDIPYRSTATPATSQTAVAAPVPSSSLPLAPPQPQVQSAYVTEVRPGPDDHSALLHVELPTCAVEPHAEVTEAAGQVQASVLFGVKETCAQQVPADITMKTAAPIGKRSVIVNREDAWGLAGTGWRRCPQIIGCDPPADHCAKPWIAQLEFSAEAEYPGTTRACDQNWLVHDLQRHSGQGANRVAYRWAGNGWVSFASSKGGGCAEIQAADPKFPTPLCQSLTPLSGTFT